MKNERIKSEPLFHLVKKDVASAKTGLLIRLAGIGIALVLCGILSVILIHENPFSIYASLFQGAFIDVWTFLQDTSVLLLFGLAVIPSFKMRFWNMGANGQVLVGCLAAVACMKFLAGKLSNGLLILVMAAASILAAVIWAVIPAVFKAFFNTNETLFTLMMNYIAICLVDYFSLAWDAKGSATLGIINQSGHEGWLPDIGNKYVLTILIALIISGIMFIYMNYTKHGFEVELVGESVNTARYVGINVKKVVIRTLVLSGLICGIVGLLFAGSIEHTVSKTTCGSLGFTAILVAWLANFDPLAMIATSLFVVFMDLGGQNISTDFHLRSTAYADLLIGIIFFCVIGSEFFIRYKIMPSGRMTEKIEAFKSRFGKGKKEDRTNV